MKVKRRLPFIDTHVLLKPQLHLCPCMCCNALCAYRHSHGRLHFLSRHSLCKARCRPSTIHKCFLFRAASLCHLARLNHFAEHLFAGLAKHKTFMPWHVRVGQRQNCWHPILFRILLFFAPITFGHLPCTFPICTSAARSISRTALWILLCKL